MAKKINSVLKEVSNKLELDRGRIKEIEDLTRRFLKELRDNIRKSGLDADAFVGGSLAKETMVKKDIYDIDIFIRFGKKHSNNELSELTWKILNKSGDLHIQRIHGSRDYFRIKISDDLVFEIIPVKKIRRPKEAENITDLSYSHVTYIKKRIKGTKIPNEIKLAKAFCYANNCYGAESYINGFSGYGLELLIYNYKSFLKFMKAMVKVKEEKLVIDIEKHHKNKRNVLLDLNESKLQSPVILVDPTYKTRNVLAALSKETFGKFQKACKNFLKNPRISAFEKKSVDIEKIKKNAERRGNEFILIEAKTNKQEGDIAGSKLKKFYEHLREEIGEYFDVKSNGFEYEKGKSAKFFFVVKRKKEVIAKGPLKSQEKHVKKFKRKHKSTFTKEGRLYSKKRFDFSGEEFFKNWKLRNLKKLKEMNITYLRIV
ncbi:MAG: nucleotidyltransferase domain-containing protein [Candidatus Pacearchaeota archaeon]